MRTLSALGIKLLITLFVAMLATYLAGIFDLWLVFVVAVVVTLANYIFGDMLILPATGNIIASIIDGAMAGFLAYVTVNGYPQENITVFAITFGILIMAAEYSFHRYVLKGKKFSTNPLD